MGKQILTRLKDNDGNSIIPIRIPSHITTWGDSITYEGQYQIGMSNELGIDINNIINAGLSSDWSQHVKKRFISYYNDASNVYQGENILAPKYSIPTLLTRQNQLNNTFIIIWLGSNNLINWNGRSYSSDSNVEQFKKIDKMYARSYLDQMFSDVKDMVNLIPHSNFLIAGGHCWIEQYADNDALNLILKFEELMQKTYPNNYLSVRSLILANYDWLDTYVTSNFVKPALNGQVTVSFSKVDWMSQASKCRGYICIGTKDLYDKYQINSIDSVNLTATITLVESNTFFNSGDTVYSNYTLCSDLNRSKISLNTKCYSFDDIQMWKTLNLPYSSTDSSMHVHPVDNTFWQLIGKWIGKEIKKKYQ